MSKYIKVKLEYTIQSSISILFSRISTAGGLNEWFADKVTVIGEIFTFSWDGNVQKAKLLFDKSNRLVRFKWLDLPDETYLELRIDVDELTGDVALIITDFLEEDDLEEGKLVWNNQIEKLKHIIGS